MILLINLINKNLPAVVLFKSGKVVSGKKLGQAKSGAVAVKEINRLIKEKELNIGKVRIFVALTGPASFSGLRSEMSVVNTLAFGFNRPVTMIDENEITELSEVPKVVAKKKLKKMVLPVYDREPNITISKK